MHYKIKEGMKVAEQGTVIIEGVEHYVTNGYVACNNSLNGSAWNVTEKEKECRKCAELKPKGQLKIF